MQVEHFLRFFHPFNTECRVSMDMDSRPEGKAKVYHNGYGIQYYPHGLSIQVRKVLFYLKVGFLMVKVERK